MVKFLNIFKNTNKMYFFVHLIPLVLYKRKDLKKQPIKTIVKFIFGWLRSMLFVCSFALLSRAAWCSAIGQGKVSYGKFTGWMILASLGILLESKSRMPEYGMNLLPRYFESLPIFLGKMRIFPNIPFGINIMSAIAFALMCKVYFSDQKSIKTQFRWLISCILGESNFEENPIEVQKSQRKSSSKQEAE